MSHACTIASSALRTALDALVADVHSASVRHLGSWFEDCQARPDAAAAPTPPPSPPKLEP